MTLLEASRNWAAKNFVDDVSLDPRDTSLTFFRGQRVVQAFYDEKRLTVLEGKSAKVFNGVSVNEAPLIVANLLSSGESPKNDFGDLFESLPYDEKFENCTIYPESVIQNGVIYRDHGGRRYLHSCETRVSLLFFKALYDRNSEAEIISLPELKPYLGEVFSSKVPYMTDETALRVTIALFSTDLKEAGSRIRSRKAHPDLLKEVKASFKFKEVLGPDEVLFEGPQKETTWSSLKEKFNLRPGLWVADTIDFYSLG